MARRGGRFRHPHLPFSERARAGGSSWEQLGAVMRAADHRLGSGAAKGSTTTVSSARLGDPQRLKTAVTRYVPARA